MKYVALVSVILLACKPASAQPSYSFLALTDTTVRYQLDCNAPAGQGIETCSWLIVKGGQPVPTAPGFSVILSHTGAPNDSVSVTATATTVRRGLFGTPASITFFAKVSDVPPPGSTGITIKLCTKNPPDCN